MKVATIFFAFFATVVWSEKCHPSSETALSGLEAFANAIQRLQARTPNGRTIFGHLYQEYCKLDGTQFEKSVNNARICSLQNMKTVCGYFKNHLEHCTEGMVTLLEDCASPTLKYLPKFIMRNFVSIMSHFCDKTGTNIFELLNPCIGITSDCMSRIRGSINRMKSPMDLTKENLCNIGSVMKNCTDVSTRRCATSETRDVVEGWVDAIFKECTNV